MKEKNPEEENHLILRKQEKENLKMIKRNQDQDQKEKDKVTEKNLTQFQKIEKVPLILIGKIITWKGNTRKNLQKSQ